jgi:hypothetical protein
MIAQKLGLRTAQPGALPYAAFYFAAGIFSRLVYSEQFKSPLVLLFATALAIVFFPVDRRARCCPAASMPTRSRHRLLRRRR